jgi:hypothetical protein
MRKAVARETPSVFMISGMVVPDFEFIMMISLIILDVVIIEEFFAIMLSQDKVTVS